MMSAIEGLFAPDFCVLSVRSVRSEAAWVVVSGGRPWCVEGYVLCVAVPLVLVVVPAAPTKSSPDIVGVSGE